MGSRWTDHLKTDLEQRPWRMGEERDIIVTYRHLRRAISWIWLLFLAAACQNTGWSATPSPAGPTSPTARPTELPTVQPTWAPTWTAQPSPTFTVASATATPVQPAVAFTLTILHTGQSYGETLPCG